MTELIFPEFDDIKVSTKTLIVVSNISINLEKLFEFLPITKYIVIPKKRGRKKENSDEIIDINKNILSGSIVTMKFENKLKGVELKHKNTKKKDVKWFRNSFTIVIIIDKKPINVKICKNGVFQITGCKFSSQAHDCVKYVWNLIKDEPELYSYKKGDYFETLFVPAMRNIDFSIGFNIDREKLANYLISQSNFHSLLESSFSYTGVNIKLKVEDDIQDMQIKKIFYKDDKWVEEDTIYKEYLSLLSEKDRKKKIDKQRYNTFLVFHSGNVIESATCSAFARKSYYYFLDIIRDCKDIVEEKLDI